MTIFCEGLQHTLNNLGEASIQEKVTTIAPHLVTCPNCQVGVREFKGLRDPARTFKTLYLQEYKLLGRRREIPQELWRAALEGYLELVAGLSTVEQATFWVIVKHRQKTRQMRRTNERKSGRAAGHHRNGHGRSLYHLQ